jgi:hypothetical protein
LYPLQNDFDWFDVDYDLHVSPIDAVLIIDYLNGIGLGAVMPDTLRPRRFTMPAAITLSARLTRST